LLLLPLPTTLQYNEDCDGLLKLKQTVQNEIFPVLLQRDEDFDGCGGFSFGESHLLFRHGLKKTANGNL
jgi:hypothetical protein